MILKVAWLNIWRNPLRSIIVLLSIVLGIWAGVFIVGFSYGLNNQRIAEAINSNLGHVQIHHPKFNEEERIAYVLPPAAVLKTALQRQPEISSYSIRTVVSGMLQSARAARGIRILGVNADAEKAVSTIPQKIHEGDWFATNKRNPLVIGKQLADLLHVTVGSKVVITFQDVENNIIAARFTLIGIYKSANSKFDELVVYCQQPDLYALIGGELNHQVVVMARETQQAEQLAANLQNELPALSVKSWREVAPELAYTDEILAVSLLVVMAILMLALMFGIINTMLMAVLERKRELGMLQAIGMNKQRISAMIVLETCLIGVIAGPLGLALGVATIRYFGEVGIDLSLFGQGLESFGISTRIYPQIEIIFMIKIAVMVGFMALVASIYPAIKALRLNSIEAIRGL